MPFKSIEKQMEQHICRNRPQTQERLMMLERYRKKLQDLHNKGGNRGDLGD